MGLTRWSPCNPCCGNPRSPYTTSIFDKETGEFLGDLDYTGRPRAQCSNADGLFVGGYSSELLTIINQGNDIYSIKIADNAVAGGWGIFGNDDILFDATGQFIVNRINEKFYPQVRAQLVRDGSLVSGNIRIKLLSAFTLPECPPGIGTATYLPSNGSFGSLDEVHKYVVKNCVYRPILRSYSPERTLDQTEPYHVLPVNNVDILDMVQDDSNVYAILDSGKTQLTTTLLSLTQPCLDKVAIEETVEVVLNDDAPIIQSQLNQPGNAGAPVIQTATQFVPDTIKNITQTNAVKTLLYDRYPVPSLNPVDYGVPRVVLNYDTGGNFELQWIALIQNYDPSSSMTLTFGNDFDVNYTANIPSGTDLAAKTTALNAPLIAAGATGRLRFYNFSEDDMTHLYIYTTNPFGGFLHFETDNGTILTGNKDTETTTFLLGGYRFSRPGSPFYYQNDSVASKAAVIKTITEVSYRDPQTGLQSYQQTDLSDFPLTYQHMDPTDDTPEDLTNIQTFFDNFIPGKFEVQEVVLPVDSGLDLFHSRALFVKCNSATVQDIKFKMVMYLHNPDPYVVIHIPSLPSSYPGTLNEHIFTRNSSFNNFKIVQSLQTGHEEESDEIPTNCNVSDIRSFFENVYNNESISANSYAFDTLAVVQINGREKYSYLRNLGRSRYTKIQISDFQSIGMRDSTYNYKKVCLTESGKLFALGNMQSVTGKFYNPLNLGNPVTKQLFEIDPDTGEILKDVLLYNDGAAYTELYYIKENPVNNLLYVGTNNITSLGIGAPAFRIYTQELTKLLETNFGTIFDIAFDSAGSFYVVCRLNNGNRGIRKFLINNAFQWEKQVNANSICCDGDRIYVACSEYRNGATVACFDASGNDVWGARNFNYFGSFKDSYTLISQMGDKIAVSGLRKQRTAKVRTIRKNLLDEVKINEQATPTT